MAGVVPGMDELRENIQTILHIELAALRQRTNADKIADAIADFTGTIFFVLMHLVWFGLWVTVNLGLIPFIRPFDRYPFSLLCMIVSLEGVLLATFVLIKQNRTGYLSNRRDHIDLQINLLAEREVTRLLQLAEAIAAKLDVPVRLEKTDLTKETSVEELAQLLDQKLPAEG